MSDNLEAGIKEGLVADIVKVGEVLGKNNLQVFKYESQCCPKCGQWIEVSVNITEEQIKADAYPKLIEVARLTAALDTGRLAPTGNLVAALKAMDVLKELGENYEA